MDKIQAITDKVSVDKLRTIVSVTDYDLSKVPDDALNKIVQIAIHCCLNGPVGTSKQTNFPGFKDRLTIKDILPGITSSPWRKICDAVAKVLLAKGSLNGLDYNMKKYGGPWPMNSFGNK